MGVLTLLQIRDEVKSSMGNRPNILDARYNVWINLAYTDVASGIDFTELDGSLVIPTVIGQNNYNGPVNPLIVQMLRDDTNNNLLGWIPGSEYFRLDRSVATAKPKRWTRRALELLVWPNPNAIYSLTAYFKITPIALSGNADVTVLPSYVDNALIMLGAAYGLLAVGEDQRAALWVNRAISFLSSRLTEQDFSFLLGGLTHTQPTVTQAMEGSASGT